jgi:hypothetical protein
MSEYVEVRSSIADMLGIANGLRARGEALTESMAAAMHAVRAAEAHPRTFPRDDFTNPFLDNYHKPVPSSDGGTLHANEAVQRSAEMLGGAMRTLGDNVARAMWAYAGTDEDNATDITKAAGA